MGLKSDSWIRKMSVEKNMIVPFAEEQVGRGVVSYGVSSYGYDIRVGDEFKIFTNIGGTVVDPKNFDEKNVVEAVQALLADDSRAREKILALREENVVNFGAAGMPIARALVAEVERLKNQSTRKTQAKKGQ